MKATKKKATGMPVPQPASAATVRDVAAEAEIVSEAVAMLRAVASEVVPRFLAHGARPPVCMLQRPGAGPRPACIPAIVVVEAELEGLARGLEERANALYGMQVDLAGHTAPESCERALVNEVVRTEEVSSFLRSGQEDGARESRAEPAERPRGRS